LELIHFWLLNAVGLPLATTGDFNGEPERTWGTFYARCPTRLVL
jgi:hypothetical protein